MAQHTLSHPSAPNTVRTMVMEHHIWFMILGITLIVLGIVAVAFPFLTTVAAKTFLGWLFLTSGIIQIFHAFFQEKWSSLLFGILVGILYMFAGAWLAFFPLTGIITLTVLLAAMFIAMGILETVMAFGLRPLEGWAWVLFAGLAALVVGVFIFVQLPSSAAWAIGLLVGIKMISSGWAYFFLAFTAGRKS